MEAIITLGISASGKSTFAGVVPHTEINRDDIRFGLVMPDAKGSWKKYKFSKENESRTTEIELKMFHDAVANKEDIIISNTNLNKNIRRQWIKRCIKAGYKVKIVVLNVPLEVAKERDSYRRERSVGCDVIASQFEKMQQALEALEMEKELFGVNVEVFNV